eukprot:2226740-Karenia_brevis.AAC.1
MSEESDKKSDDVDIDALEPSRYAAPTADDELMMDPLQGPAASSPTTQNDPYTDATPMKDESSPGVERSRAASRRP